MTLSGDEPIGSVLESIRKAPRRTVIVDATRHRYLSRQPQLRRLLTTACAGMGKRLVFAVTTASTDSRRFPSDDPVHPVKHLAEQRSPGADGVRKGTTRVDSPPRPARADAPPLSALFLAAAAVALLVTVIILVVPRATVSLEVAVEPLATDLTMFLTAEASASNPASGLAAGEYLVRDLEMNQEFHVGTVIEKGERASGFAELVNGTSRSQGIKAQTRLQGSSGVILRTVRDAIVPPRARLRVAVRADTGGVEGNLQRQKLVMPGLPVEARSILFAEVTEPLSGGTSRKVRQLAQADVQGGLSVLTDRVRQQLVDAVRHHRLSQVTGGRDQENFERPELMRMTIHAVETSTPVGTETESFRLRARMRGEALTADSAALRTYIQDVLRQTVGTGKDTVWTGTLDDIRVISVQWGKRQAELSLHVEATVVPRLDIDTLRRHIASTSKQTAESYLRSLPGVRSASVTLVPRWLRRVPDNSRNIRMTIRRERAP